MSFIRIFILLMLTLRASSSLADPPALKLSQNKKYLIEKLNFYIDPSNSLTLEQILEISEWQPSSVAAFNFGLSHATHWFHFILENPESEVQDWILELDYAPLDYVYLYVVSENQGVIEKLSGDMLEFSQREIQFRKSSFPLRLNPEEKAKIYLKIKTQSSIQGPITLWSPAAFAEKISEENAGYGVYIGIMIAMVVYNFILFFNIRERSQLYYILYILMYSYSFLSISGFSSQNITPNWPYISNILTPISIGVAGVFVMLFSAEFLNLRAKFTFLYRLTQIFMAWGAFAAISAFFSYHMGIKLAASFSVFGSIFLFFVGLYVLSKDYHSAKFFVIAFVVLLLGVAIHNLTTFGAFNPGFFTQNSMHIGSAIQVMVLSLAIGDKFKRQQNEAKEKIENLNEKLQIEHEKVRKLNSELNEKVDEQTRDIRSMLDNISMGIFTITAAGTIGERYSKQLEDILEIKNIAGQPYSEIIFSRSNCCQEDISKSKAVIDSSLGEPIYAFSMNEKCLVSEFIYTTDKGQEKYLEINWNPILDREENIDRILVSLRDVTKIRELEEFSKQKKTELDFISEVVQVGKDRYRRFISSSEKLLEENHRLIHSISQYNVETLKIIFINLHTLKGLARSLNFTRLSELVHKSEEYVSETQLDPKLWDKGRLVDDHKNIEDMLNYYIYINDTVLERPIESSGIELKIEQISSVMEDLRNFNPNYLDKEVANFIEKVDRMLSSSYYISANELLSEIFSTTKRLAKDLKKPEPKVEINNMDFEFTPDGYELLRNVFVHLIRNSLDHGLEFAQERLSNGKSEAGTLYLQLEDIGDGLKLLFWDDGRGLAIRSIKELAHVQGYIDSGMDLDDATISEVLFRPGFSTSQSTSEISGRGVGMSAIKNYLEGFGGSFSLKILPDNEIKISGFYRPFKSEIILPPKLYRRLQKESFPKRVA